MAWPYYNSPGSSIIRLISDFKNRLNTVAWIVLFLPYVLFAFIVVYAMSMGALAVVRGKTGLLSGGFKVGAGHCTDGH